MPRVELERIVSEVGVCPVDAAGERQCVMSTAQMMELISKK